MDFKRIMPSFAKKMKMNIARNLYYAFPPSMRLYARRLFYLPIDLYETILHKRDRMVPPRGMIFIGSGDFRKQGLHLLDLVIKYAHLKPDGKILDVGCGIGRLAIPLTKYLNANGRYEGFDIVKKGIDWCNRKITLDFPNFHFLCIELKNDLYNLSTNNEAKDFEFPYSPNTFDCVVLTSVFTHMMPKDVYNYLKQISLVMKEDGECLATFFLLNAEVKQKMNENKIEFKFSHFYEGYSLMNEKVKEANIAFDETYLFSMLEENGLYAQSVHYGSWSKRTSSLDFQDVVIIKKYLK